MKTTHEENLVALKRIEGQIRGIQKMIEEKKYCINIVEQVHAAMNALNRVAENIFIKHIEGCVVFSLKGKSERDKIEKIDEIMKVIRKMYKIL